MSEVRTNWNKGQPIPAHDVRTASEALAGLVKSPELAGRGVPRNDARYTVQITARSAEGVFEFAQVRYKPTDGKIALVSGGVTHETLGLITAEGGQPDGGAGLIYVGDIVTIRPGVNIDSSGRQQWEFSPAAKTMPVDVVQVGGADGTDSSAATWTYNVYAEDGDILLEAATPQNKRPSAGQVQAADHGYVHYELVSGVPTLTLGWVNEGPEGPSVDNEGYNATEGGGTEVDTPAMGGTTAHAHDGNLKFIGMSNTAIDQPQTSHIPVRTKVETDGDDAEVKQWISNTDLPVDPDTQGFETVTDGTTSVSETDGGIIEFDTATGLSDGQLPVNFEVTNNSPTATVTGYVDLGDVDPPTVGGVAFLDKLLKVNDGATTGVYEIDDANYGERNFIYYIRRFSGADATWQQTSGTTSAVAGKHGSSAAVDLTIASYGEGVFFLDVSDSNKLKFNLTTAPSGSVYYYQILIIKGARKTTPDQTIT